MSHHASGPNFGFSRRNAQLDMTDLYAFTKPGDRNKSVLVLNVWSPPVSTKTTFELMNLLATKIGMAFRWEFA